MKAEIIKRAVLENIPSGSGVEVIQGIFYIIGDDSSFLFKLDHSLKLLEKIELFPNDSTELRIAKKIKPDYECMSQLRIHELDHILIMGSGSTENRNKGHLVKLPTRYNKKCVIQNISFEALYDFLRKNPDVTGNGKLNLEALAINEEHLMLMNRGNKSGKNSVMVFSKEEFLVYLTENPEMIPFPSVYHYDLGALGSVPLGFTGACVFETNLFFTAAAEDTDDAYDDGAVNGSAIGVIALQKTEFLRGGNYKTLSDKVTVCPVTQNGTLYPGKIESISVYEKDSDKKFAAVAITDDDKGGSELLLIEIELD